MTEALVISDDRGPSTLVTEAKLVAAVRFIARKIVEDPAVRQALAASESLQAGLIVSSEDAAVTVVDSVRTVIDGERTLTTKLREVLRISDAMEAAARQAVAVEFATLKGAKERGNAARVAWQQEQRRRAAALEAQQREAARKAAEAAALAAAEVGDDDVPPEAEVAPVVVARTVQAGAAKAGTMVKVKAMEIISLDLVPREWLSLVTAPAEASFRAAVAAGLVGKPEPGDSVMFRGVRFEAVESAVNRS